MKSYLYAPALVCLVATPTMAAEQLTANEMDQVTAGWVLSDPHAAARMMPGMTKAGTAKTQPTTVPTVPTSTSAQPSFEVIINNQGVFITHEGSIDLAMLATLPNSAFTVTSIANSIVLGVK